MPKVIYIRHGESESNQMINEVLKNKKTLSIEQENQIKTNSNPNLTILGNMQAIATARYLSKILENYKTIQIWTSPYKRAQQTAHSLIELNNDIKLEIITELYEYTKHVKQFDELSKLNIIKDDNWNKFTERVLNFNNKLKQKLLNMNENEILLVFGHSVFLSVLMSYQISQEKDNSIDTTIFHLPNCCINTLEFKSNK